MFDVEVPFSYGIRVAIYIAKNLQNSHVEVCFYALRNTLIDK